MRLWHYALLPYLPRLQLVSQWRECCCIAKSIAEKGTPNHVLVNRIMDYPLNHFAIYTAYVIEEMKHRKYKVNPERFWGWLAATDWIPAECDGRELFEGWHDDIYLRECLYNVEEKARAGAIPADEWRVIYEHFKGFTPLWEGKT